MADTRQPQFPDSGHAQLSLFGAGEPQNTLPPANAPVGPCAPEAALSRVDIHAPEGLASEFSAAQSTAPPPLALPSNPATVLSGQGAESTGVATPEAGQPEQSANACILSSPLILNQQDAGLGPLANRFTVESLAQAVTLINRRPGWQALLKRVRQKQVGLILVSESSRLARSSVDFEDLLLLCLMSDTLLAVEGSILDLNVSSNRLMARIKAIFDQFENEERCERFMKAKLTKAQQAFAVTHPPTGYVVSQKGKWVKDPDVSVRQAIEEMFRQYQALGTIGKVSIFFRRHELKLPRRIGPGDLRWVRPSRARMHQMLTNPAFAGYSVFGRQPKRKIGCGGSRRPTTWDDWTVVPDRHEAYISPADWHRIQDRLRSNRVTVRQPAGSGPALCQGLMRCGRCGRTMSTRYYDSARRKGITYVCGRAWVLYGEPACWAIEGTRLDKVVAAEILRSLAPPNLDAVIAAANDVNAGFEAERRQRQVELERVRYEAELAKRRFRQVDPENRLVAAALESDLELALVKCREVERKQAETPLVPPIDMTPGTLSAIRDLAVDLPRLWAAPSTTVQDRKDLTRLFVREIRLVRNTDIDFEVEIAWIGGAVSKHRIYQPTAVGAIARQLAAQGLDAGPIAAELNRLNVRPAQEKHGPYTRTDVCRILATYAKKVGPPKPPWRLCREELRAPLTELVSAGWKDAAIAEEFNRRGLKTAHEMCWTSIRIRNLRRAFGYWPLRNPLLQGVTPPAPPTEPTSGRPRCEQS